MALSTTKASLDSGCLSRMSDEHEGIDRIELSSERISVYRLAEGSRVLGEKAARLAEEILFNLEGAIEAADRAVKAGELGEDVARELREIHTLVRQRALSEQPQGRLV